MEYKSNCCGYDIADEEDYMGRCTKCHEHCIADPGIDEYWDFLISELGLLQDKEKKEYIREYGRRCALYEKLIGLI